jgi:hypothetical protein
MEVPRESNGLRALDMQFQTTQIHHAENTNCSVSYSCVTKTDGSGPLAGASANNRTLCLRADGIHKRYARKSEVDPIIMNSQFLRYIPNRGAYRSPALTRNTPHSFGPNFVREPRLGYNIVKQDRHMWLERMAQILQ